MQLCKCNKKTEVHWNPDIPSGCSLPEHFLGVIFLTKMLRNVFLGVGLGIFLQIVVVARDNVRGTPWGVAYMPFHSR